MNRTTRGSTPKIPKDKPPISTIKQYLTQEVSTKSPGTIKKIEKKGMITKGSGELNPANTDTSTEGEQDFSEKWRSQDQTHGRYQRKK